jgi:hypothetical protein
MNRTRGDSGYALITAVLTMGVATSLILVMIGYAIQAGNDSGRFRQRTIAVHSAEAVVDAAYAGLEAAAPSSLPCAWPPTGPLDVATQPRTQAAQATITYTFKNGATGCPGPTNSRDVVSALITAKATAQAGSGSGRTRYMQSNVLLTPVYDGLDKAIFATGGVTANNQAQISGNRGTDADVYAENGFTCSNNFDIAGSLLVQGPVTLSQPCSVAGDVWATGNITTDNRSIIGGRVLTSGGSVSLSGNTGVTGTVLASGSVNWSGCSTSAKCFPGSTVAAPASQAFPTITYNEAHWVAAGYTIVTRDQCGGNQLSGGSASNNPNKWMNGLATGATVLTGKTVLRTPCPIELSNPGIMKLPFDLAVFADGGFATSQRAIFQSTGGQRLLHWIVPVGALGTTTNPCTSNSYPAPNNISNIRTDNQFGTASNINMLIYTPCSVSFSNSSRHVGQIYARGTVQLNNRFNLAFRPVPVFGTSFASGTSGTIKNYKVEILYKRENAS